MAFLRTAPLAACHVSQSISDCQFSPFSALKVSIADFSTSEQITPAIKNDRRSVQRTLQVGGARTPSSPWTLSSPPLTTPRCCQEDQAQSRAKAQETDVSRLFRACLASSLLPNAERAVHGVTGGLLVPTLSPVRKTTSSLLLEACYQHYLSQTPSPLT